SGAMGGSASEEFLAIAENGEDTFVRSPGGYAANVEAVDVPQAEPVPYDDVPAAEVVDTPDTPTIETLVDCLNAEHPRADGREWTAADTLKNVIVTLVHPDGRREPLAIGVPGDRAVDEKRLAAQVEPAEVVPFEDGDFVKHPTLAKGYIGPGVLGETNASGIRYLLDPRIAVGSAWATGADKPGFHVIDLVHGRDFTADGTIQAAEVRDGDPAPDGSGPLSSAHGIEMGHIFQLGKKYAEALGLQVLDQNGKLVTVTMGSYGVGVTRAVAAVAEGNYDELGLVWPREVSPADVHLVATGKGSEVFEKAAALAEELDARGIKVLYDDREKVSPGVKFKDAELIGVPTIAVVGKGLAEGTIEVKDRRTGNREDVPLDTIVDHLAAIAAG
ncbi:MAG TPA: His/Gly/Thr/Pro-type tRNA ligase C-terminal domain-containing protein, partial [Kribbellaceae bacterium]